MAQIKDIELGTKYVDRKNPKRIGEVIEVNEKTKTVTLQFADGKSRPFVVTTLSKSFKMLDNAETTEEVTPEVAEDKTEQAEDKKSEKPAESKKTSTEELKKLNESAKKTSEIINKAEAKEEAEKKSKKKAPKEKKPKKEDKQVIEIAIKAMDELKAVHKESWQNKGTAMYIGKVRVFECWKRMERIRINYNPALTSIDAKMCIEKIEDKRANSHLSVTCYVSADKVADAISALVKNTNTKEADALNAKKSEKKSKPDKKAEKTETIKTEKTK